MAPKEDKHAIFSLFCNLVALLLLQISVASAIPHYEENNYYINAAQADNSCPESDALEVCQSAQVEGASDVSNYFSVCPDDGDPGNQNVCYYSNTPCCSPSIVPQLTSCNSSSTLLVAGTEVQVTFLNLFTAGNNVPDEVCFQVEPDLSHCNEECEISCISTDQVCFENTITGDVSSCNEGICTCKDGYLPPDCCQCNTDTHYGNGTVCKPFCRENCIGSGPNGGCAACKDGFITAPECCDCAEPGTRPVNGICVCDKEQDLYFLIDATISYDYTPFCSMMIVAQMLAAAFNPTSSSGTKLYGVLFQHSGTDVEKVFDLGDSCNMVSNQLKTLTKDFSTCKESAYGETTFKSVCASKTIAIKGLQEIEKEAKVSTKEQKAVLILTDGTIDDPNNELGTVKSSLKLAGIETIIAARVGTDQVNDNLKKYANNASNAIVADEPLELGRKIVERLSAEGILCNDHAGRIKDSLKAVSEMTATLPYFCDCVPEVVSGKGCYLSGREVTLKFPECGGSLNIEFNIGSQEAAKQGDSKLKAETKLLEQEIFAAVEKVLDTFEG